MISLVSYLTASISSSFSRSLCSISDLRAARAAVALASLFSASLSASSVSRRAAARLSRSAVRAAFAAVRSLRRLLASLRALLASRSWSEICMTRYITLSKYLENPEPCSYSEA